VTASTAVTAGSVVREKGVVAGGEGLGFVAKGADYWSQVRILTARSLRMSFSDRKLLLIGLAQPVVMLVIFSQLFKSLGTLNAFAMFGHNYSDYIIPPTLVNIGLTTALSSSSGIIAEVFTGFIGRLRVMPVSLFTVLIARTISDMARLVIQLLVATIGSVVFLDFHPKGGVVGLTGALLLITFFGWGLGWVFIALSTWARKPETLQLVSFIVMFPVMFGTTAFVPAELLPTWLRYVAKANPLNYAIEASRGLCLQTPLHNNVWLTIAIVSGLALVGIKASAYNFRRAT